MKLIEGFQVNNTIGHTIQQLGEKKVKWNEREKMQIIRKPTVTIKIQNTKAIARS